MIIKIDTKMTYEEYRNADKIEFLSLVDIINEEESEEDNNE